MARPELSLAMSMFANKGAYALLLGSGLSSAAGIPTGWEVSRDFIRHACLLTGDDPGDDPGAWFEARFGKLATYSNVLEAFDPSQGGRSGLLRSYFEANQEDRDAGRKMPTEAHHAIASLIAKGYVRVVVSTNFDTLLEQALDAAGVPHQVIASPDDVDGARPFMLADCTVIKVNGDYRDTRIKNTDEELGGYDPRMQGVILKMLDDLGLVVCGWSADSDAALAKIVRAHQSRQFSTFWTYRHAPSGIAAELIEARRAQLLKIDDANSFFRQIEEHTTALERSLGQQTLDARAVFESVKRYVAEDRYRVQLEDLVIRQMRELVAALPNHAQPGNTHGVSPGQIKERIAIYEAASERICAAMVAGCFWGDDRHRRIWANVVTQLAALPGEEHGYRTRPDRRLYPALLAMYAGGIAAVASGRYDNLAAVLVQARARTNVAGDFTFDPVLFEVNPWRVLHEHEMATLSEISLQYGTLNYYLRDTLLPSFSSLFVREQDYDLWFDRFEYLAMLIHARLYKELTGRLWSPRGKLVLRGRRGESARRELVGGLLDEAQSEGETWGAVRAGLFSGVGEFEQLVQETEPWADNL